ncbi:MAG: filamentous hemagglutinin N-terminal domain-containing protein, partial [Alphaproteobacteria bacterium]|nr:filamentous hemagglutinin N-terminal domain-containing protein [Alphaproteobacteria bacterium]
MSTLLSAGVAHAGPQVNYVVGGAKNATVTSGDNGATTVNQTSRNTIINWNTFNLGPSESVNFNFSGGGAWSVLNRVTGGRSSIDGSITASPLGSVFIVNRDGIIFGPDTRINVGSFLATTSDISNRDFRHRHYNFSIPGQPWASIKAREGSAITATAASGGFAALVAPHVRNSGTITAKLGTVALGAGNIFNIDFYGDGLIALHVSEKTAKSLTEESSGKKLDLKVTNDGVLRANGGRVELTAATARGIVDSVINTSGVIEANSIRSRNGQIVLSAETVNVSGTVSAAGRRHDTTGGDIVIAGDKIKVTDARIDASGRIGGGRVLIGPSNRDDRDRSYGYTEGDHSPPVAARVSIGGETSINVSATRRGEGGDVIVVGDKIKIADTTINVSARRGEGGDVTIAGDKVKVSDASIDASGRNGGDVVIAGDKIKVADTTINASGRDGGGQVAIGIDQNAKPHEGEGSQTPRLASRVRIDGETTIDVSATRRGEGGDIVILGDKIKVADTTINAS